MRLDQITWGAIVLAFFVAEFHAIQNAKDKFQPLTYHIRKVFHLNDRRSIFYWLGAGIMAWLVKHFLIDS